MSRKEILAYAITHAPRGQKGGPYEADRAAYGSGTPQLSAAARWTFRPVVALGLVRRSIPHARVIRIVRKARPSEASAVEVLRELVASLASREGLVQDAEAIADNVLDFVAHTFDPGIGSPKAAWVRVLHEYGTVITRAEKAERERDEALGRAQSETEWRVRAVSERQDAEAERDDLRAKLARLTAPGEGSEGEPGFEHLRDCWDMAPRADASGSDVFRNGFFALYRLGVAHERARQQPRDRATDEELVAIAETAYEAAGRGRGGCVEAAALAVAARVRQERVL